MRITIISDVKSEVIISEGMLTVINPVKVEFDEMGRKEPESPAAPEEEVVSPPPSKKKSPVKKKLQLDMNKAFALWNAGWSYVKIADEMGVSVPTLKSRMREWTPPEEASEETIFEEN